MQMITTMPQSYIVEPIKLGNVQLVTVESLWVLTQSACGENEHNLQVFFGNDVIPNNNLDVMEHIRGVGIKFS